MVGWKSIVQSSLPCLLLLFWGSWSDRHHRRKPCMIVPIIGECMKIIGLLLCYYFVKWPMEYVGIVESLCLAITGIHHKVALIDFKSFCIIIGGWSLMIMAVYSYISEVSSVEQRTLRVGILNLCIALSVPLGMAFSGILLEYKSEIT